MLLGDLWRLLALSTTGLVTVIAFAAAVRPLAEGQVGPLDALRFMGLAVVPMLQFALPFASGFAATLSHHRFSSENEALAASAGGISYRALLVPAGVTGLLAALVVAGLSHQVIPKFYRAMELVAHRDAARVIESQIRQGQTVNLGDMIVRADDVHRLQPEHGPATDVLVMDGVLAMSLDENGDVKADVTAERADVWLTTERRPDGTDATVVRMRLRGATWWQREGGLGDQGELEVRPFVFPHDFRDRPKFRTYDELVAMRDNPDLNRSVDARRRALAAALAQALAQREVGHAMDAEGRVTLLGRDGQRISVQGGRVERVALGKVRFVPPSGQRLEATRRLSDGSIRRHLAASAALSLSSEARSGATAATLRLQGVETPEVGGASRRELTFTDLRLRNDPSEGLFATGSSALLASASSVAAELEAAGWSGSAEATRKAMEELEERIQRLRGDIVGNHHERFALSAACLVMTLTGAVMALRLREGMPLTVYLWSFFPALGAVVTISGGEHIVPRHETLGLTLLWGGVAALTLYTLAAYRGLARH